MQSAPIVKCENIDDEHLGVDGSQGVFLYDSIIILMIEIVYKHSFCLKIICKGKDEGSLRPSPWIVERIYEIGKWDNNYNCEKNLIKQSR